eukprot:2777935-Ditylum_brightwellii.AAC.1
MWKRFGNNGGRSSKAHKKTYFVGDINEDKYPFCALLDVGCKTTTTGCHIFGALKGAAGSGLDIPQYEKHFPGE